MASKRLLLYATDTYKLSSLLLRRVLLTKPTTLSAYREKTRQLLLDQSRPAAAAASTSSPSTSQSTSTANTMNTVAVANKAAIKLLEWDREWNLIRYYGVENYVRRWWASKSWSSSSLPFSNILKNRSTTSTGISSNNKRPVNEGHLNQTQAGSIDKNNNVAKVAFMITSNQRHRLSTELGYDSNDIRSFKPLEALLLLEHGVKKSVNFRVELKGFMEENDRLMNNQQQSQSQTQVPVENIDGGSSALPNRDESSEDGPKTNVSVQQSTSTEEAEQIHAKPDVAIALVSADEHANEQREDSIHTMGEVKGDDSGSSTNFTGINETSPSSAISSIVTHTEQTSSAAASRDPRSRETSFSPAILRDVTPHESEELHMKPDVAAAIIASRQQRQQQHREGEEPLSVDVPEEMNDDDDDDDDDESCWYEVIEKRVSTQSPMTGSPSPGSESTKDEQVIALFPTKREALECVRIKHRSRGRDDDDVDGEGSWDDIFHVRRRWNV